MISMNEAHSELRPALDGFIAAISGAPVRTRVNEAWLPSERYPVSCTVSVMENDPAGDEIVVLELGVWSDGSRLRATVDFSRGDGALICEGPTLEGSVFAVSDLEVLAWLREASSFIRTSQPMALAELQARR